MIARHKLKYTLGGCLLVVLLAVWASFVGSLNISFHDIIYNQTQQSIWLELRLPRVLLALIIGASLAVAGASIQALFKNPMADPSLLGVSSGAALAVGFIIVLGASDFIIFKPIAAFVGAVISVVIVFKLATRNGVTHITSLLLAGIAMNALAASAIGALIYLSSEQELRHLTFWMLGEIPILSYEKIALIAIVSILSIILLIRKAKVMNILTLGEENAQAIGVNLKHAKIYIILLTSLLSGIAVSFCGIIGFIGLIVPHIVRLVIGVGNHNLMIFSAILGAITLLGADTLARTIIEPASLPIGIITGLVGGPFFMWLLYKQTESSI